MPPTREDFIRWREDLVTRWVMAGLTQRAEHQRLDWLGISWGNGQANGTALKELRAQAMAMIELVDGDYEYWCSVLGEEPREE